MGESAEKPSVWAGQTVMNPAGQLESVLLLKPKGEKLCAKQGRSQKSLRQKL